jgi:hypothetical protein
MTTNDADVLALEPCPLCGDRDQVVSRDVTSFGSTLVISRWEVGCLTCGVKVHRGNQTNAEKAWNKLWNTRALSRPVPEGFVLVPREELQRWIEAFGAFIIEKNGADNHVLDRLYEMKALAAKQENGR